MALLKLAALGTLGYVGYQYYQKNFARSPRRTRVRRRTAVEPPHQRARCRT